MVKPILQVLRLLGGVHGRLWLLSDAFILPKRSEFSWFKSLPDLAWV